MVAWDITWDDAAELGKVPPATKSQEGTAAAGDAQLTKLTVVTTMYGLPQQRKSDDWLLIALVWEFFSV